MNVLNLIFARRTIHNYVNKNVPNDVISNAIVAATHAPNHKMTAPWQFIIAGPKSREKLANLSVELKAKKNNKTATDTERAATLKKFLEPGVLVVLGQKKCASETQAREDYAAVSCGVQNMSLYLWSEGYGAKWTTGEVTRHSETYNILGVDSRVTELVGFLWVGEAANTPEKQERPDVKGITRTVD